MRSSVRFVIIAATLAVAGCGGGSTTTSITTSASTTTTSTTATAVSKKDYAKKLAQVMTPFAASSLKLGVAFRQVYPSNGGTPTTREQLTSVMASYNDTVQKASQELDALDPPSAAASSNAHLVTGFNKLAKSGAQAEEALKSGTKQQVHAQVGAFLSVQAAFNSTLQRIRNQLKSEGIPLPGA